MTGELWPLRFIWHHDLTVTHCQSSTMIFVFTQYSFCNSFRHCLLASTCWSMHGECLLSPRLIYIVLISMLASGEGALKKFLISPKDFYLHILWQSTKLSNTKKKMLNKPNFLKYSHFLKEEFSYKKFKKVLEWISWNTILLVKTDKFRKFPLFYH